MCGPKFCSMRITQDLHANTEERTEERTEKATALPLA
jgi:hypothetical protein